MMIRYFKDEDGKPKVPEFLKTGFWLLMGFCLGCIVIDYIYL
jgi:hypothetical protein